mgnify:CR=1 FL=1
MRSWNCKACNFHFEEKYVRNLPMRSWNNNMRLLFGQFGFWFAIYQWGVETCKVAFKTESILSVRNLPMRSWNYSEAIEYLRARGSSQFTNEELKLWKNICSNGGKSCSQFTNEELKHNRKLVGGSDADRFAIYQWGVETPMLLIQLQFLKLFAIYQWGVETCYSTKMLVSSGNSSQFTNEELKQVKR